MRTSTIVSYNEALSFYRLTYISDTLMLPHVRDYLNIFSIQLYVALAIHMHYINLWYKFFAKATVINNDIDAKFCKYIASSLHVKDP